MRNYEEASEIDRSCNNCGESEWSVFEEQEYGGERDQKICKTYLSCRSCNSEGRLFEENNNIQWSGNLR